MAGQAIRADPRDTAPRLYVESLNEMIDQQLRVAGLNNRVPTEVLILHEVIGSAIAMFLLGLHLGLLGRSLLPLLLASCLVVLLFAVFDLDRPTRGFIEIPNTPWPPLGPPWTILRPPARLMNTRSGTAGSPVRDDAASMGPELRSRR